MISTIEELGTPGCKIRNRRIELGKTLQEIASVVHITKSYLARIEKDQHTPKDPAVIKGLERALEYSDGSLYELFFHWKSTRSQSNFIELFKIVRTAIKVLNQDQLTVVSRVNHRIRLFGEDQRLLASNFLAFLAGELQLDELPENKLRPLNHYIIEYSPEICEPWNSSTPRITQSDINIDQGFRGKPDAN